MALQLLIYLQMQVFSLTTSGVVFHKPLTALPAKVESIGVMTLVLTPVFGHLLLLVVRKLTCMLVLLAKQAVWVMTWVLSLTSIL